jgi:hypothetical protein
MSAAEKVLEQMRAEKAANVATIRNYAFGWKDGMPAHEKDLRVHYHLDRGRAYAYLIECDNGRSKPCFEKVVLPECVIEDVEREVNQEIRDRNSVGDEE